MPFKHTSSSLMDKEVGLLVVEVEKGSNERFRKGKKDNLA